MVRAPVLAGSRIAVGTFGDDVELLLPPSPGAGLRDVGAAVRDALRFPLAGPPLEAALAAGQPVTIVLDAAALPLPPPARDPRQAALAALVGELERLGVPTRRQTILVAGGLSRRAEARDLESRIGRLLARRFAGDVRTHDAEDPELVPIGEHGAGPIRVDPHLARTGTVVTLTAAETVLHGGPAALLAAAGADTIRAADADASLLESGGAAWQAAVAVERALARRGPVFGVSLALGHPRWGGALRGVPYERGAVERFARSPVRRAFGLLPAALRRRIIAGLRPEVGVEAVFAGPPSVAHAEALLRSVELRSRTLRAPLDALVLGVPPLTPNPPIERPNPLDAAYLALGHALRLWRGRFPVAEGGSLILQHRLHRRFAHPTQTPYRAFFAALRESESREPELLAGAERRAAADSRAVEAYRAGRSCHPRLPFAQWEACAPARRGLRDVLVAGCRDATAARQLGFVPVGGLPAALDMVRGACGPGTSIGLVLAPPFFPLSLSS